MVKIPTYESGVPIANGNAGGAASYQSASAFVSAADAQRPQELAHLARGLGAVGAEVHRAVITQRQQDLELDLLQSMQEERKSASAFVDSYMQTNKGASARDAEAAWQQYYTPRMEALRGQYGHNPIALKHIERQGGALDLHMADGMRGYSMKEGEGYKDSVYQGELEGAKNTLEDWRTPWEQRNGVMQELFRKTISFYGGKGRDATAAVEKLKAFEGAAREKMVDGGMAALIQQNPAKTYALLEQNPGALAAAFEGGNAGSNAIGYDKKGGTSYGKYQLASAPGTMDSFVGWLEKNGHADAATALRSAGPANTESKEGAMPTVWKQLVQAGAITDDMQEQFIKESHVTPVLESLGGDVQQAIGSDARLAAAVHSTAVQHGSRNGTKLVQRAWAASGGDSAQFLDTLYSSRAGQFGSSDAATQASVVARLGNERALLDTILEPGKRATYMGKARAAMRQQEAENKQQAAILLHDKENYLSYATSTGDYAPLEKLEGQLIAIGQPEQALDVQETRTLLQQVQPFISGSPAVPLAEARAEVQRFFAETMTPENAAKVEKVAGMADRAVQQRITAFQKDPLGFVASNPALQEEGITDEARIAKALELQQEMGRGLVFTPKVLGAQQAAALKTQYDETPDTKEKAQLVVGMANSYGRYAAQAFHEADLPQAVTAFAPILQNPALPGSTAARLVAAADMKDGEFTTLAGEQAKVFKEAAATSEMVETLHTMQRAMYAAPEQAALATSMERALSGFLALGGKLQDVEGQFTIINDSGAAIIAPREVCPEGTEDILEDKRHELIAGNNKSGPLGQVYRAMYANGLWVFDGEGFALVDSATGRLAIDGSGKPVQIAPQAIKAAGPAKGRAKVNFEDYVNH